MLKLMRGSRPSVAQMFASNGPLAANASPTVRASSASIAVSLKTKTVHRFASGPLPSRADALRYVFPIFEVIRTGALSSTPLSKTRALIGAPPLRSLEGDRRFAYNVDRAGREAAQSSKARSPNYRGRAFRTYGGPLLTRPPAQRRITPPL